MDRNTLLAFFLIALVLIFTPKYMEIVSPPSPDGFPADSISGDKHRSYKTVSPSLPEKKITKNTPSLSTFYYTTSEKITTVETPLYTAVLSSRGGGTIQSFHIKNYYTADSQMVNVLTGLGGLNILTKVNNADGQPMNLSVPWQQFGGFSERVLEKTETLTYSFELSPGKHIRRVLTFDPDTYIIDIDLRCDDIRDLISGDLEIGWYGGLASTEKNQKDDHVYFKSYIYQGGEIENLKVSPGETESVLFNGPAEWGAIRTKYFVSALIPRDLSGVRRASLTAKYDSLETYNVSFFVDITNVPNFSLYLGPLEYEKIKNLGVGLEQIMDFGWAFIRPISKGVLFALKSMHEYIPNYGFVLIIFSFLIKIIVYPLTKKSYQSTAAMQVVQPEISALREKYKNNSQKLNQATMKLYKERGVNPLGGCLPMLLQMPLLFALFIVFRTTIELRSEPFIWWIKDLSAPDTIFELPFTIPIFGSQIAVLPILMVISMFIQQKMMSGGIQQPQQKTLQYFMTGFFYLIFNSFPSGLNLYYTLFNVLTIAQQKLIPPVSSTSEK